MMNPFNKIIEDIDKKNLDQPKYTNIREILETDTANAILQYYKSVFDLTNPETIDEIQLPITKGTSAKKILYIETGNKIIEWLKTDRYGLYPDQYDILLQTEKYFCGNNNGILNLFCRYGKTKLSCMFTKHMKYKKIIILVPSIYLVEQTFEEWKLHYDPKIIYKVSSEELINKELLVKNLKKQSEYICICVYNSSGHLVDLNFDIGIYDEAHRTTYCSSGDNYYQTLLKSDKIEKKLFLTATLRSHVSNEVVYSMDNEDIYGKIISTISAKKALELGRICPYKIVVLNLKNTITDDDILSTKIDAFISKLKIDTSSEESETLELFIKSPKSKRNDLKEIKNYYMKCAKALLEMTKENKIEHVITYHNTITRCKLFQHILKLLGHEHSEYVEGKHSKSVRKNLIDKFQTKCGEIQFLHSARILQEGVNIPICDAVCFIDIKSSLVDTTQALARCLTKYEGKELAHIIIPFDNKQDIKNDSVTNDLRLILKNIIECDENLKGFFTKVNYLKCLSESESNRYNEKEKQEELIKLMSQYSVDFSTDLLDDLSNICYLTYSQSKDKINGKYKNIKEYKENVINDWGGTIPLNPDKIYKNFGWNGYSNYLGIGDLDIKCDYKKIDFIFSKAVRCIINKKPVEKLAYRQILLIIYENINNKDKIIKNTTLNFKSGKINGSGFNTYLDKYDLSIQDADANKRVREILKMSEINNIECEIDIKIKNETIYKFKVCDGMTIYSI